jgi:hypothetical protein
MIYTNSRYYDGPLSQDGESISVNRLFPKTRTVRLQAYIWKQNDRIDAIADLYLGNPEYWWKIMDLNPDISDPFFIRPGTAIRLPRG